MTAQGNSIPKWPPLSVSVDRSVPVDGFNLSHFGHFGLQARRAVDVEVGFLCDAHSAPAQATALAVVVLRGAVQRASVVPDGCSNSGRKQMISRAAARLERIKGGEGGGEAGIRNENDLPISPAEFQRKRTCRS